MMDTTLGYPCVGRRGSGGARDAQRKADEN